MSELVTVITPCYNHQRYIGACIESVLGQTYQDWEQIVVDDGSTDDSAAIVESYGDPRVRLLRLPHRGLASLGATYNAALEQSRGSLIAVLEGDDAWPSTKLATQVAAFQDPAVFLSWGRASLIDAAGTRLRGASTVRSGSHFVDFDSTSMFHRLVRVNMLSPAASVMARRSVLERIGGFHQDGSRHYVDLPTWLTLVARVEGTVRFVNAELAYYRVHAEQTTQRHRLAMESEFQSVVSTILDTLDSEQCERLDCRRAREQARAAASISAARRLLSEKAYAKARRGFVEALSISHRSGDRGKAALGFISGLVHFDLLSAGLLLREKYITRSSRFSPPD